MNEIKKTFLEAVATNNEDDVKSSLKQFANNKIDINDLNLNIIALKYAIHNKNASVVKLLLEHGADITKNLDDSPLMCFAAEIGDVKIADLLLKHKASACEKNRYKTTPLHIACANGHVEMVKFLLNNLPKQSVNNKELDNTTPLHYAAGERKAWMSFGICDKVNFSINDFKEITTNNLNGRKEIVELLLDHGAEINAKGPENKTALHYCATCPNIIIAELLISRGIIDINAKTTGSKEYSAMHLAAEAGNNEMIELLLNNGADIEINAGDERATPLICAVSAGHRDAIKLLLNRGANIEAKSWGSTSLMKSVCGSNKEMASFLLTQGANINAKDDCGQTALHYAAESYYRQTLDWLMKHGSDINSNDEDNFTPLDCAVRKGYLEIVQRLLDQGAVINTKVEDMWSPIYCAAVKNREEIFRVLLENGALLDDNDPSRDVRSDRHPLVKIDKFFIKETTKLKSLSHYATDDYVEDIERNKSLKDYWENCKKEIEDMKKEYFTDTNVSYYNVLVTSRTDKLATLVGNENIAKVLNSESLKERFPIYAESLEKRIKAGVTRKDLLERVKHFFHVITDDKGEKLPRLPWNCVHEIFSYLTSNIDLKELIVASLKLNTEDNIYDSDGSDHSSGFESPWSDDDDDDESGTDEDSD